MICNLRSMTKFSDGCHHLTQFISSHVKILRFRNGENLLDHKNTSCSL